MDNIYLCEQGWLIWTTFTCVSKAGSYGQHLLGEQGWLIWTTFTCVGKALFHMDFINLSGKGLSQTDWTS
jgi:hypothetical protein